MRVLALIVAGGQGARFGRDQPKQYVDLQGEAVLRRSIRPFLAHPAVTEVRVVGCAEHLEFFSRATEGLNIGAMIEGGASRQESVRNGLEAAAEAPPEFVLVHDAARPLVSTEVIDRVIEGLSEHVAILPAIAVVDTLKRVVDGEIRGEVDRSQLQRAQTPQGFHFNEILAAHRQFAGQNATDDTALMVNAGHNVHVVAGDERNLKITQMDDLMRAEAFLSNMSPARKLRVGSGFDVHAFAEERPLILGGIEIPGGPGLAGHSDADVLLHAITDAILGGLALGDIGMHFPPSDARWKDADSGDLLRHILGLLQQRNGCIEHLDATVICEKPKIGPHRDALRRSIASMCGVGLESVSVKATTTEKLGFTGRGEGIAAQATATLSFPGGA